MPLGPLPCEAERARATPSTANAGSIATLAATTLGSSLAFVDGSVVNVALPAISEDLGVGAAGLAWVISAYFLTLSSLMLLGGGLGDHFGRRRLFLLGVGVFLVASVGCAVAPSTEILLSARATQGVGAAFLLPNSLALLGANFDGEAKGQAIGTWAAAGAAAGAIGPVLGGWLVDAVGWRSIFILNIPIGAAAFLLGITYVEESRDLRSKATLDTGGAMLVTIALGLLAWSLTSASGSSRADAVTVGTAVAGSLLLVAFIYVERRRGEHALMPLFLLSERSFVGITLLTFLLYAALGGLIVLLPFVLMTAQGYSPVTAGLAMLPIPALIALGSRFMGRMSGKIGARMPIGIGGLIVSLGFLFYLRIGTASGSYFKEILPGTVCVAVGMALCVAPLTTIVVESVDNNHVGVASGFNNAVARIGNLFAAALLSFVFVDRNSAEALIVNAHRACLVGAILAGLAGACALVLLPSDRAQPEPR